MPLPPCPCSGQQAAEFVAAGVYNKRRHLLGPATGKQGAVGHERRHRLFAYAWCLYARDRSTDTCPLSSSCHVCSLSRWLRATCSTHSLPYTHSRHASFARVRATHTHQPGLRAIPALRLTSCASHSAGPQRYPRARADATPSRIVLVHGGLKLGQSLLRCLVPDPTARGCCE